MKTRARSVLERRFRQWANGKALAAFSAAVLLGLTFSPQQADAQSCALGYGGPVVRVYVHTLNIEGLFSRQLVDTLCLSGLLDKEGRQYVSLMGTAGDGVYSFTDPDTFDTASF